MFVSHLRRCLLALNSVLALLAACAPRAPVPLDAARLRRFVSTPSRASAYTAEVRLTYFGEAGRLRGTASLLVARPNRLRYELQGPHGGVLSALACDGNELSAIDFAAARFTQRAADAAGFDALLPLVPLGLDAAGWVSLLLGEVTPPPEATLSFDAEHSAPLWQWAADGRQVQLWVDADNGLPVAATLQAGPAVCRVRIEARDASGVPVALHLQSGATEVDVRLRDLALDPPLGPNVFTLGAPRGFTADKPVDSRL